MDRDTGHRMIGALSQSRPRKTHLNFFLLLIPMDFALLAVQGQTLLNSGERIILPD